MIGMPEGRIILAQAAVAVATAPKSNASYLGIEAAIKDVRAGKSDPVPARCVILITLAQRIWECPDTNMLTTIRITL